MRIALREVCEFINGGAWSQDEYCEAGIPVLKVSNLQKESIDFENIDFISENSLSKYYKNKLFAGDLVIATVGSHPNLVNSAAGRTIIIPTAAEGYLLNQNAVCVRTSNPEVLDQGFLAYFGKSFYFQHYIQQRGIGAASQMRIAIDAIKNFEISLPPPPFQRRIASVLSCYDALLENYQQQVKALEGLANELYREWFVRGRCPGAEAEPESELPAGWQRVKFTEVISVQSGGTPQTSQPNYWDGDVYWFSPGDVENSYYVFTTDKTITEEGLRNCNSKLYPVDTVVITARGTVGKCVLLGRPMAINQSNYALIGRSVSQYFTFFKTLEIAEGLQKEANGAVFSTITTDNFERAEILVPDADSLAAFDKLVAPMFGAIRNYLEQSATLRTTRDALLPRLLSGQLTVHAAETTLAA